ncbi:MAG: YSC84-related protein [Woeseiaceae bacterium]|nr:YSC84-related protein [Woeseiaceae bacterium]
MRSPLRSALVIVGLLVAGAAAADDFEATTEMFRGAVADEFFEESYGYAVFPTIGKGGVVVGGARGKGQVYAEGEHVGDTTMTQVTVGLQLGGQAYSQIIFFQDRRAFEEFTSGNFEFGAQATAVAITAGASATAGTTGTGAGASTTGGHTGKTGGNYYRGMAVFTFAKGGLMYEASIGGQKFSYKPKK